MISTRESINSATVRLDRMVSRIQKLVAAKAGRKFNFDLAITLQT